MSEFTLQEAKAALAKAEADLAKLKAVKFSQDEFVLETLKKERETQLYLSIAAAILVAGLALAFPVFSAYQEAAAYNRITNGPHVTTWEALFLELRVDACNGQP